MFEVDQSIDWELLPECEWLKEIDSHVAKEAFGPATKLAEGKLKSDKVGQAAANYAIAKIKFLQGQQAEAKAAAEDALAKFRDYGGGMGEAVALNTLAQIKLNDNSDLDGVLEQATDALAQFQKAGNGKGEAAVLNTIAKVHYLKKDAEEALNQADLAHQSFEAADDKVGEAASLMTKATIFLLTGNFEYAAALSEEAATLCKTVTTSAARAQEANAFLINSAASISSRKSDEALKSAKAANALFTELGGEFGKAKSLRALAFCHVSMGNIDEAVKCVEEAIPFAEKHANKNLKASVLGVGALAYRHKLAGDKTPANEQKTLNMVKDALACYQQVGDEQAAALMRIDLAQTHIECGNMSEALDEAKKSQEAFERLGENMGEGIASLTISELQYNMGQTAEAVNTANKAKGLLADFDGANEADKLLAIMQAGTQQKTGAISTWPTVPSIRYQEPPNSGGGVSKTLYSRLWLNACKGPDRCDEIAFDAEGIQHMGNMLGCNMPFLYTWNQNTGGGGAAAPAAKKKTGAATLERQVEGPTQAEREQPTEALSIKPSIIGGDDILGGRHWDCPEELHNRMVALARRGEIPITKPTQRENNSRKRGTFHGSAQWREASMMGYIHPDIPAPKGTKWKKVAFGWKLLDA